MASELSPAAGMFNKVDGFVPTLVGNWAEERALAARTGVHRLQSWCPSMTEATTNVYPPHVGQAARHGVASLPRTLEHDEQLLSAEWLSTNSIVYQPQPRVGDLVHYDTVEKVGRREAMELAALLEAAKQMQPRPQPLPDQMHTTYRDQFTQHDTSEITIGRSRMKNQDGGPVHRDADFLAETRTLPREFADRHVVARDQLLQSQRTRVLPGDVPISIYSEKVANGTYAGTSVYGTQPYGVSAFGKMTNFTKQMGDYSKDPSDE